MPVKPEGKVVRAIDHDRLMSVLRKHGAIHD